MKAVVLCAGFGTRLAPLTDRLPKPLVPVANRPVLDLVLDRLFAAGVAEIGINLHHHAERIQAHLAGREGIRTVYEPRILDTGGGVANFRAWIEESGDPAVLLHNSDVVTDIDSRALWDAHAESGAEVTLAVVDHPPTNVVAVAPDCAVTGIHLAAPGCEMLTYACVAVLSRRFLRRLVPNVKASLIDAIRIQMREAPGSVRAYRPAPGTFWRDLGQVQDYLELHRELLVTGRFAPPGMERPADGILVDPRARIERSAKLQGFVAVGPGCHIESGVRLADCVVWPGTHLAGNFAADRAVILQDLVVAA